MPADATAGWKPDDSCGAKKKTPTKANQQQKERERERKHRVSAMHVLHTIHFCAGGKHKVYDFIWVVRGLREN